MRNLLVGGLILLMISGCARKKAEQDSRVSIRTPSTPLLGKSSSLAASDKSVVGTRKECYAVSVTGPGIAGTAGHTAAAPTCSPETGLIAGFVGNGQELSLEIPRGDKRKFELYLFLQKEGEDNPCPTMGATIPKSLLMQTYLIGTTEDVSLLSADSVVDIRMNFPGYPNNLAKQMELPYSCLPQNAESGHLNFQISSSRGYSSGAGLQMKARAGSVYGANSVVLKSSKFQLRIK